MSIHKTAFLLLVLTIAYVCHAGSEFGRAGPNYDQMNVDWSASFTSGQYAIQTCLRKITEDETWTEVKHTNREICDDQRGFQNEVSYKIRAIRSKIQIELNLAFRNWGDEKTKEQLMAALHCAMDFYKANGLDLQINGSIKNKDFDPNYTCDAKVDLSTHGHSNCNHWHMNPENMNISPNERCAVVAHEVGHLLGLNDTYPSAECRSRKIGKPTDLMNVPSYGVTIDRVKLTEDETRNIIKPLCDPDPSKGNK